MEFKEGTCYISDDSLICIKECIGSTLSDLIRVEKIYIEDAYIKNHTYTIAKFKNLLKYENYIPFKSYLYDSIKKRVTDVRTIIGDISKEVVKLVESNKKSYEIGKYYKILFSANTGYDSCYVHIIKGKDNNSLLIDRFSLKMDYGQVKNITHSTWNTLVGDFDDEVNKAFKIIEITPDAFQGIENSYKEFYSIMVQMAKTILHF